MDFISENQLQKYEAIISTIEEYFEENKRLKNILEIENNKIFLQKLSRNNIISKLSHINVKIFRNVMDIYFLYEKESLTPYEHLKMYANVKFYLIEVYLTKLLLQKLRNLQWSLQVTISHDNTCTSKVINAMHKGDIIDIVPIDESVINSVLHVDLIVQLGDQMTVINLDKTKIDISYHFSSSSYKKNELSRTQKLLNITKLYNPNSIIDKCALPILDYEMILDIDVQEFMSVFIKNCYHSVNLDAFEEMVNASSNNVEFTLVYGQQQKYSINFNKNKVIISAHYMDLYLLKKYFYKIFHSHKKQANYEELKRLKVRIYSSIIVKSHMINE